MSLVTEPLLALSRIAARCMLTLHAPARLVVSWRLQRMALKDRLSQAPCITIAHMVDPTGYMGVADRRPI